MWYYVLMVEETEVTEESEEGLIEKPIRKKSRIWLFFIALIPAVLIGFIYIYHVRPITDSFTYELGEEISEDLKDYVEGFPLSVNSCELDLSDVDRAHPGRYIAVVRHFPFEYNYELVIRDTTSPVMADYSAQKVFELGKSYTVKDVVGRVYDNDPAFIAEFVEPGGPVEGVEINGDTVSFSRILRTDMTVRAKDPSGNVSSISFIAVADTPPLVNVYEDYYTAKGTPVDFRPYAVDLKDGDVSDSVSVKIDPDYYKITGAYNAVISAEDSYGLRCEAKTTVHVYEPETIQDMINTGRLDGLADNVFGAVNPYDAGYVVGNDIKTATEHLIPAIVRVSYDNSDVSAYGSGTIVKISDKGIIICTNRHVVDENYAVDVHFYDGTVVKGKVEGRSKTPDVAFVRVNVNQIDEELLHSLRTAHINLEYYNTLSNKPSFEVGMYCTDGEGGEWLRRFGYIKRKSGWLDAYFEDYDYAFTQVSVDLTPGVSGSMVFDSHGNFICMATFFWMNGEMKENYGVSLDSILDFYETTFGRRLEYN